jgi:hypothetical protein
VIEETQRLLVGRLGLGLWDARGPVHGTNLASGETREQTHRFCVSFMAQGRRSKRANVPRYPAETLEAMQKHLLSYRDNLRVEVEPGVPVAARTVAELRTLSAWPSHLILDIHIDLDPALSMVTVRRAS